MDVVETLVRASKPPLSDALMQTFPCAVRSALTSDDPTIVQARIGTLNSCLTAEILTAM